MKEHITALKIYVSALAMGLFIVGWVLVVRVENTKAVTQNSAPRRIVVVVQQPGATGPVAGGAQTVAALPDLPPIPAPPAVIRTRTS